MCYRLIIMYIATNYNLFIVLNQFPKSLQLIDGSRAEGICMHIINA